MILIQKYLEDQSKEKSNFLQGLPTTITSKAQNDKNTIVLIIGGLLILWRIVLHVIDGIHLWGVGYGIIAGIIVGVIEGILYAIIWCAIVYILLSILFHFDNNSSIKRKQDSTNQTLNQINQNLIQINEQKNNFSYTFNRNKSEANKLSRKNQLLNDVELELFSDEVDGEDKLKQLYRYFGVPYKRRSSATRFDMDNDDDDDDCPPF